MTAHRTNRWTGATGSEFRIIIGPAQLLANAVARSTPPFGVFPMNRLPVIIVIVFVLLGTSCRRSTTSALVADAQPSPSPLTEFVSTGETTMYSEIYFRRSDGAVLQFGCQDHITTSAALGVFRGRLWDPQITPVIDLYGAEIGKRFVWQDEIVWNEGARLFYIDAPSLQDALTFERSNVWKDSDCWDFRSWDRATEQIVGREPR